MAEETAEEGASQAIVVALEALFGAPDELSLVQALNAHPVLLDKHIDRIIGYMAINEPELDARRVVDARRRWLADKRAQLLRGPGSFLRQALQVLPSLEQHGRGVIWAGFASALSVYGLAHQRTIPSELSEQLLNLLDESTGLVSQYGTANDLALLQHYLVFALQDRLTDNRSEHQERAIRALERALAAFG